jgi:hypothetical protein
MAMVLRVRFDERATSCSASSPSWVLRLRFVAPRLGFFCFPSSSLMMMMLALRIRFEQ